MRSMWSSVKIPVGKGQTVFDISNMECLQLVKCIQFPYNATFVAMSDQAILHVSIPIGFNVHSKV